MRLKNNIDLHMHSTVSDGTDNPAALLDCVRAAGLKLFSLTDHDAIKGCAQIGSITFLWDGVKGLQTRKSNATAGLSDIYGQHIAPSCS